MKRAIVAILALIAGVGVCEGRTITVDDDGLADFPTIQAAIDDANDGDTIIVADGTYTGPGNREIMFLGKAITLRSENGPDDCVIDGQGSYMPFKFIRDELPDSVLDGFTIINGADSGVFCSLSSPTITTCVITNNVRSYGGGLYCIDSSPIIENCRFVGNRASSMYGGGVYSVRGEGLLRNCVISGNTAAISGGGVALFNSTMTIENCLIIGNTAERDYGGGIYLGGCWNRVTNCTIVGNSAAQRGGGLGVGLTVVAVSNCIMRDNVAGADPEISSNDSYSTVTVSCSNVEGGHAGTDNIDDDPCFADPCNGDYHLESEAGRWDVNEGGWTTDEVTSSCIDAGDPMGPIKLEPFPNGRIVNMGAYGGTSEASKSYFGEPMCETAVAGDINGDCEVDFLDLRIMALNWLGGNEVADSNCRVEDGIEYCFQTDNSVYHSGQAVAMLYGVTNLGDEDVELYFPHTPEWNFWVEKDGENTWTAVQGWWTFMTWLELRPGEEKEYLHVWDMKDNRGALVGPGEYEVTGGFDAGTDGYGDYDFSKVSVTIEIEP